MKSYTILTPARSTAAVAITRPAYYIVKADTYEVDSAGMLRVFRVGKDGFRELPAMLTVVSGAWESIAETLEVK